MESGYAGVYSSSTWRRQARIKQQEVIFKTFNIGVSYWKKNQKFSSGRGIFSSLHVILKYHKYLVNKCCGVNFK